VKLTYDPRYNMAYIHLKEKTAEVETVHISEELNIDLAPDGMVYGIELLNVNEQLTPSYSGKLVVVNEECGQTTEIALSQ